MNKGKLFLSLIILLSLILLNVLISLKAGEQTPGPNYSRHDVSAFYYAASVVLDSSIPNSVIYDTEAMRSISQKYGITSTPFPFVYSIASAYIMSPLTILPYEKATVLWNLLNIIMYIFAVAIVLRISSVPKGWFIGCLSILLLWGPFIYNQFWFQSNALLIFIVSLALLVVKERPILGGLLIGTASLFKLFPLALAMILGVKNWRIFASCAGIFAASFLIPGSLEWFAAINNTHPSGSRIGTPVYLFLSQFTDIWFFVYALIIAGITAITAFRNRSADYPIFLGFAIPAAFLVSPMADYHHLTMVALSFAIILANVEKLPCIFLMVAFLSFIFIETGLFMSNVNPIGIQVMVGIFLLWIIMFYKIVTSGCNVPGK